MTTNNKIRNFSIIGHIDHGKSTLADRLLSLTGTVAQREMREQVLDTHPISRERGVTIKMAAVRMEWQGWVFNLIDTPGHVDFSYEVSRSLAACEGAVLVIDGVAGVQAQTVSYYQKALEENLLIIPVVNKIDLPGFDRSRIEDDLKQSFAFKKEELVFISAKKNQGIDELLQVIIERVPMPAGLADGHLRALIFNSFYDKHKGVIIAVRVINGLIDKAACRPAVKFITKLPKLQLLRSGTEFEAMEIGYFSPDLKPSGQLLNGEVGYIATGIKNIELCQVGDTVTLSQLKIKVIPLPGYQQPKPVVFMGLYTLENKDFPLLKKWLKELKLNDAALQFKESSSSVLGHGFQVGFLGLFHAEIVQERLERDYGLELVRTQPQITYKLKIKNEKLKIIFIRSASELIDAYDVIEEQWARVIIFTPKDYLGRVMELLDKHRGQFKNMIYHQEFVELKYDLSFAELISGFFDQLKSVSRGFANLDYQLNGFRTLDAVRMDILINYQPVSELSQIAVRSKVETRGRELVQKLKKVLTRQQFAVPIQAVIGKRVVARETVPAFRKDVTAKLYGGDVTRKRKLLEKQRRGKKRLRRFGKVEISQEVLLAAME